MVRESTSSGKIASVTGLLCSNILVEGILSPDFRSNRVKVNIIILLKKSIYETQAPHLHVRVGIFSKNELLVYNELEEKQINMPCTPNVQFHTFVINESANPDPRLHLTRIQIHNLYR